MKINLAAYLVNLAAIGMIGFLGGRLFGIRTASATIIKSLKKIHEDASTHLASLDNEDPDYPKTSEYIRGQVDLAGFLIESSTKKQ